MTDNKLCKGNLMKEGIIMWAVFTKEGKAALRMDYEVHPENGKVDYGRLLSPDMPVLHEILMPDDTSGFLSLPEYGVSVRIRLRLRYPETEDSAVKHSEYEPKTCFSAWIVPHENGQVGLYLKEPSTGQCFIPDIAGLPGVPELKPESHPVKLEMLICRAHCIFDRVDPAFLKISSNSECLKKIYCAKGGEAIRDHRRGTEHIAKKFENGLQAYTPFWGRINDGDNSLVDKFHNYIKRVTEKEPGCIITATGSSKGWDALARHTVHDHKSLFRRIVEYIRRCNPLYGFFFRNYTQGYEMKGESGKYHSRIKKQ